jgi:hypothetical protein
MTAVGKGLEAYVAVDASGTFSETKRQVGLLRMLQAGVILSDYATLMVEILKDNARPEAGEVYGAMDMGWAKLVGQIAKGYGKQSPGGAATTSCRAALARRAGRRAFWETRETGGQVFENRDILAMVKSR